MIFLVLGIVWILPLLPLIRWMQKPDGAWTLQRRRTCSAAATCFVSRNRVMIERRVHPGGTYQPPPTRSPCRCRRRFGTAALRSCPSRRNRGRCSRRCRGAGFAWSPGLSLGSSGSSLVMAFAPSLEDRTRGGSCAESQIWDYDVLGPALSHKASALRRGTEPWTRMVRVTRRCGGAPVASPIPGRIRWSVPYSNARHRPGAGAAAGRRRPVPVPHRLGRSGIGRGGRSGDGAADGEPPRTPMLPRHPATGDRERETSAQRRDRQDQRRNCAGQTTFHEHLDQPLCASGGRSGPPRF